MPAPLRRETPRTARRGRRELPTTAAVDVDVLFILWFSVAEPGVDVELILGRRTILAEAFATFLRMSHIVCSTNSIAEDGVRCAVKIRVRPRVGRI